VRTRTGKQKPATFAECQNRVLKTNKKFLQTILVEVKRLQIQLFDPPKAEGFEFAVKRDIELSKKCSEH